MNPVSSTIRREDILTWPTHNIIGQAIKIAENEEKKLAREGLTEEFNEKFEEFLNLGTLRAHY